MYPESATLGMTAIVTGRITQKVTMAPNVGQEEGAGSLAFSCPNGLATPVTAYCTATEKMVSDDGGDSYGEPDTTTAKIRPCAPHPSKVNGRSVRLEPSRMKLDSSSSVDDVNRTERNGAYQRNQGRRKDGRCNVIE